MKNIEAKKLRSDMNIIDIRDRSEYSNGHIYNSVNIPMNELINNYNKYLDKSETYYIYCMLGSRSKKVCEMLSLLGYDVINVLDGYDGYKK